MPLVLGALLVFGFGFVEVTGAVAACCWCSFSFFSQRLVFGFFKSFGEAFLVGSVTGAVVGTTFFCGGEGGGLVGRVLLGCLVFGFFKSFGEAFLVGSVMGAVLGTTFFSGGEGGGLVGRVLLGRALAFAEAI